MPYELLHAPGFDAGLRRANARGGRGPDHTRLRCSGGEAVRANQPGHAPDETDPHSQSSGGDHPYGRLHSPFYRASGSPGFCPCRCLRLDLAPHLHGIALGFLIGLLRWRLHVATAMEHFARRAIARPSRENLQVALAETLEDPTLELAVWRDGDHGGWVDQKGTPVDVERPGLERSVTRIGDNGRPGMALVHDHALREHLEFVDAAGSVALFALENERLTGSLRSSLRELEGSRTRIVAAAERNAA